jgi:serine/threonine protein kinase
MSQDPASKDADLLKKLLLGQLPSAQAEKLVLDYADDSRIAEVGESLASQSDTMMDLLPGQETTVNPDVEHLVARLQQRLQNVVPEGSNPIIETAAATEVTANSAAGASSQQLPSKLDCYQPLRILGQGGMGTVYLALDTRLGREVALKTMRPDQAADPQSKERFLREARAAAKLSHDHIVPIFYVGEADGIPFLAMPFLKGEPLDALIRKAAGPLPAAFVIRLAREVASGLAAAHERGLIHRDIKPGNIWLEAPTGRAKILDFGLAKAADACDESDTETNLTASGAIVGTPAYMAPEQASGYPVDARADLFSVGCVLYELLSGRRAFSGPNTMSILMSLANHTPAAPETLSSNCPPALSQLVMKLLEKNPANRPATAAAVIQALDAMQADPATRSTDTLELPVSQAIQVAPQQGSSSLPPTAGLRATGGGDQPRGRSAIRRRTPPGFRVALAFCGALAMVLCGVVYFVKTDQGTLVVKIEDPAVEAVLVKDGLVIRDKDSSRTWTITAAETKSLPTGKYQVDGQPRLHLVITDGTGEELTAESFTLKRKGEIRIAVTLDAAAAVAATGAKLPGAMPTDVDRRAAEWVLSAGGIIHIKVDGAEPQLKPGDSLPAGQFELTFVRMPFSDRVNDATLAVFKGCRHVKNLNLNGCGVSDVGIANFKGCKLDSLAVGDTHVTDAGLAHFRDCKELWELQLGSPGITDAGLAHFKDCEKLEHLSLRTSKVTDEGLSLLAGWRNIVTINLSDTVLSDVTLERLAGCPQLASMIVTKTRVSEAGVQKLSAALPGCRIEWDGGVIESRGAVPSIPPATEPLADRALPFVRVSPTGEVRGEYRFANEALAIVQEDDILEVHGNGPFKVGQITCRDSSLHIRAGKGYRPRFVAGFEIPASAREFQAGPVEWFKLENVTLSIEGCDFIGGLCTAFHQFAGTGGNWSFEGCRLIQPASGASVILAFHGDSIIVRNSLLSIVTTGGHIANLGGVDRIRFEGNVLQGATAMVVDADLPQQITLNGNIFYRSLPIMTYKTKKTGDHPLVEAKDNVIILSPLFWTFGETPPMPHPGLTWKGRGNRYLPVQPGFLWERPVGEGEAASGLATVAEWNEYWKSPDDLTQIDAVKFAWDLFDQADWTVGRERIGAEIAAARKRFPDLAQLGPDIARVGSGAAYDETLRTDNAAPIESRVAALEGGPFVLIRDGKDIEGHVSLPNVLPHVKDGDVIEVRSDGSFPAFLHYNPFNFRLTVRAGAGYRPSFAQFIVNDSGGDWTLEGLHFRGKVGEPALSCRARRIANCSVDSVASDGRFESIRIACPVEFKQSIEIVNCYFPNRLNLLGSRARVQNSVVASVGSDPQGEPSLEIVRSCIWSHFTPRQRDLGPAFWSTPSLRCIDCLIDADFLDHSAKFPWQGERNLYRFSRVQWPFVVAAKDQYKEIWSLADWQKHWNSDVGSHEDDSIVFRKELWSAK